MANHKPMADRTFEFSCAVIAEFRRQRPYDEAERTLWSELLKTQTSLANNSAESTGAHSRRDFVQKFQISLKEARECYQLLRTLRQTSPDRQPQLTALLEQCDEIIAILVSSLKTAKRKRS
jgi:four helix bundle protein